jgi:hypothetical protein
MHGTLLYPLSGQPRFAPPKSSGLPRLPKLSPGIRKRIAMWKRILLAELLYRTGMRPR